MIVGIRFLTLFSSIRILRAGNKGKGIVVCNYARAGKHFLCGGQGRGGREEETETGEGRGVQAVAGGGGTKVGA
jgi:hypothetical protein